MMPRSAIGRHETSFLLSSPNTLISMQLSRYARGFSLLEILVVVTLVAIMAVAIGTYVVSGNQTRQLNHTRATVEDFFRTLSEQSVFLGELLAVELFEDRLVPYRYSLEEGGFVVMAADLAGNPGTFRLEDSLRLTWVLDDFESGDPDAMPSVAEAVAERRSDDAEADDNPPRPQVYFLPSGEATAIRIEIETRDSDQIIRQSFRVDSLGRVRKVEEEL